MLKWVQLYGFGKMLCNVDKEKAGWLVGLGGLLLIVSHFVRSKFHAYR
jgi:hypothetical protein